MTIRRTGQRVEARGRKRGGRHSRKKSRKVQWLSVTALAVLGTVVVMHPDAADRRSLAAEATWSNTPVAEAAPPVATPTPKPVATPTQKLTTPLRPAPSLTRQPKSAKPNVTVSSGKLAVVPGFDKADGVRDKLTYRVEIEQGLSVNGAAVAKIIHQTLTDPRGWQAVHPVSFERTDKVDADLRIILATPALTDKLCLPLDTGGEVSCRVEDRVVLNAKRWMYAIPSYDVTLYRSYLVNHEVGHALGHGHSTCTKPKTPAPVMMQQTKGLAGCLPNAWPTIKAT
jgi:hypothetical protein